MFQTANQILVCDDDDNFMTTKKDDCRPPALGSPTWNRVFVPSWREKAQGKRRNTQWGISIPLKKQTNMGDNWYWLVVEPYPSEKYESQLGLLFPSYEK
jgi:hypothetical protein